MFPLKVLPVPNNTHPSCLELYKIDFYYHYLFVIDKLPCLSLRTRTDVRLSPLAQASQSFGVTLVILNILKQDFLFISKPNHRQHRFHSFTITLYKILLNLFHFFSISSEFHKSFIQVHILNDKDCAWSNIVLQSSKCFTAHTVKNLKLRQSIFSVSISRSLYPIYHKALPRSQQKTDHAELLSLSIRSIYWLLS